MLKTEDVAYRRPANGLPPKDLYKIEGKKLIRDISEGESLNLSDFEINVMEKNPKITIVGAGITGIAAGLYCKKRGYHARYMAEQEGGWNT